MRSPHPSFSRRYAASNPAAPWNWRTGHTGRVFHYAIATGRAERNPAADIRGALPPGKEKHHAAITDPKAIGALLHAIDGYQGNFITQCALRLAPLTFVRPGELRKAEWSEIDLEAAEWRIPAQRMKMRAIHIVPLSDQALASLRELHPLTGSERYVFPGLRTPSRPMSENTVNAALRRLGYAKDEMSVRPVGTYHGESSTFPVLTGWRDTPSCWLRCPTRLGRWMPCRASCSRVGAWCGRGRAAGRMR